LTKRETDFLSPFCALKISVLSDSIFVNLLEFQLIIMPVLDLQCEIQFFQLTFA